MHILCTNFQIHECVNVQHGKQHLVVFSFHFGNVLFKIERFSLEKNDVNWNNVRNAT